MYTVLNTDDRIERIFDNITDAMAFADTFPIKKRPLVIGPIYRAWMARADHGLNRDKDYFKDLPDDFAPPWR